MRTTILNLRRKYFQQWSLPVIEAIKTLPGSFLRSTKFITEFDVFLNKYNICEFYLLDIMGSYVGLDIDGNLYCFLVKSKAQMDYYIETAKNFYVDKDILIALKEKQKLPYFFNDIQERADIGQWKNMCYDINKCVDNFYITMTKIDFPLDQKKTNCGF